MKHAFRLPLPRPPACCLPLVMLGPILAGASVAHALDFSLADGEVTGTLDSTLSYGQLWRVQGQARNNDAINQNDGNRNFDTGLASEVFKLTSELEMKYQHYGAFVRGTAFYDTQIMDKRSDYHHNQAVSEPSQNSPKDNGFTHEARHTSGRKAQILDAYLYGSWDILDRPISIRAGKQVFNWGEALFYRGVGISNPIDAPKYRLPGAQIKEVVVPVEALSFNLGLSDSISIDAYYQFRWKETAIDPVGTYYSTTDLFGPGGNSAYARVPELAPAIAGYQLLAGLPGTGLGLGPRDASRYLDASNGIFKVASVGSDEQARNGGQFGVSLHYIAESLNFTDFGFYFVNYHTKEPVQSTDFNGYHGMDLAPLQAMLGAEAAQALATLDLAQNAVVRRAYVEDVRMFGASFNTTISDASVFGEITYRPNLPVAVSATNDIVADLISQGVTGVSNLYDRSLPDDQACGLIAGTRLCRSGRADNYQRVEAINISLGTLYNFGPALGFDSLIGIGELATEQLHGSDLTYVGYGPFAVERKFAGTPDRADNPIDRESYGYTLRLQGTWSDVYAGVNLTPFLVHSHDFKGNSHLTGSFMEGRKAYSVGLRADYLNSLEAGVQYTSFYGTGQSNLIRDRDHVSIDIQYAF